MESTGRVKLLDGGLDLLGRVGFQGWSMRAVEDEAGVPHGTARHHFGNQRGLIMAMVRHLLAVDRPVDGESPNEQVARWLEPEAGWTRARYELIVASFHDEELAAELVRARDQLVGELTSQGVRGGAARDLACALDGLVLDALLRRSPGASVDAERMIRQFSAGESA